MPNNRIKNFMYGKLRGRLGRSFRQASAVSVLGIILLLAPKAPIFAAGAEFTEVTGVNNPFNGVSVGLSSTPSFVDVDSDGDMDTFIGEYNGNINFFRNTGTPLAPIFTETTGVSNPFNGVDVGLYSAPTFVDIDADGDKDAFIGELNGSILFYLNTGTPLVPIFTATIGASNPLNGIDVGTYAAPSFVDLDTDGDMDLIIGEQNGSIIYYRNTGTPFTAIFIATTGVVNPFTGVDVGGFSTPSFIDMDSDGDMDAFIGESDGSINFFRNTGTPLVPIFTETTGADNPFNGVLVGLFSAPSFVDVDGDGDKDAFIGEEDGNINFYRNTADNTLSPNFVARTGSRNPFNGVDVGLYSAPNFADVDSDGALDAFIGELNGSIKFYTNTGTPLAPIFTEQTGTSNPFNGVDVGTYATPTFVDMDADGDMDAFIGEQNGSILFYRNTGVSLIPVFTQQTGASNPFSGVDVGGFSTPSFVDIDGDADMDAFIGESDGSINFFRNTGTPLVPVFTETTGANNPFNGVIVGLFSAPTFVDVDADGDMDAFIGEEDGTINFYRNTGTRQVPVFFAQTGANNPFDGVNVGGASMPSFADLDTDGDMDAYIGDGDGFINALVNAVSVTQEINLHSGWNMIALYIEPGTSVVPLLAGIQSDMILMKNGAGEVYWPEFSVDQIVDWKSEAGYLIDMSAPAILHVTGAEIKATRLPISLGAGWNMAAYPRQSSMAVGTALAGISSGLVLVKDGDGGVYWPSLVIDSIGNMQPGQGYQIYMSSPVTLNYPD